MAAFWQAVDSAGGSPLIEPADKIDGYFHGGQAWRVTFLWDDRRHPVEKVSMLSGLGSVDWGDSVLLPLGDTGIRYFETVLPAGSVLPYALVAGPPEPKPGDAGEAFDAWVKRYRLADPHNPSTWPALTDPLARARLADLPAGVPGAVRSLLSLPGAPALPAEVATRGRWQRASLRSRVLGDERELFLYRPANLAEPTPAQPRRLVFVLDGEAWETQYAVSQALDALAAAGRLPPMAAIFVAARNRDIELPPNEAFARFMTDEVLPWARGQIDDATTRPDQLVITGFSYGGLAAAWLGFREPAAFGRVLSASGAFWWTPAVATKDGAGEAASLAVTTARLGLPALPDVGARGPGDDWLTRAFAVTARLPLQFYLSAGRLETGLHGSAGNLDNQRRFRDVLVARGYPVRDREGPGAHDQLEWGKAIVDGLPWLIPAGR